MKRKDAARTPKSMWKEEDTQKKGEGKLVLDIDPDISTTQEATECVGVCDAALASGGACTEGLMLRLYVFKSVCATNTPQIVGEEVAAKSK